jgi:hypothetical protein
MKQNLKAGSAAFLAAIALGISVRVYADGAQDSTVQPPSNQHVIAFLLQSADWYRHMLAERQIATDPADLILQEFCP